MREMRLEEVVEVNPEVLGAGTPSSLNFRYIDLSAVSRGTISWHQLDIHKRSTAPSRAQRRVRRGDCLFGTVRPLQQSHGYIDKNVDLLVASTGFAVLRAKPGIANSRFIYHWMLSSSALTQSDALAVGSSYPAVNESDVSKFRIVLPSLVEQQRIAEILDTLDAQIKSSQLLVEKVTLLQDGVIESIFSEISPNGCIGELLTGTPKNGIYKPSSDYADSGTPIIRIDRIQRGEIQSQETLPRVKLSKSEEVQFALQADDILINRVNSIDYVGKSALIRDLQETTVFESNMMRCRVNRNVAIPKFVATWLGTSHAMRHFRSSAKSAIAQASVNQRDIRACPVPIADLNRQGDVIRIVDGIRAQKHLRELELKKLQLLKQGLMDDLLSGRVRTPEAEAVLEDL
ncbi:restriction endonuclease subunit S [Acrocarpospora catenulata]|uniref:restriction endonuclease subunit S n=1 Tax=Acrocarpospora catenulata TaxID=2836182 RepID=UPI001BD9E485|nr:restriction endonuclease subunit S [Acrocarpospora catenulata]